MVMSGSAGAQTLTVETTGTNAITPGAGADTVTLGAGTDKIIVNGAEAGTQETANVTFKDLATGESVTVAGLTLTANDSIAAAAVAEGFANLAAGANEGQTVTNGDWSGTLSTEWASGAATSDTVTFTAETPGNVTDIVVDGSAGVEEVQTIALTKVSLVEGATYTLSVGTTNLVTEALAANPTIASLVTALQAADGYTTAGFTVAADGNDLKVTWVEAGAQTNKATLTETTSAEVGTDTGTATSGGTTGTITISNATLAAGSTYTLTVGENSVTTKGLSDNQIGTLVSAITTADGYNGLGCEVSGESTTLTLTWDSNLSEDVTLSLTATSHEQNVDTGETKTTGSAGAVPDVATTDGVDATDASDSNPVDDGWDVITGFDAAAGDTIKLSGNTIATTGDGLTITSGVVTAFTSAETFAEKVDAVFDGLANTTEVVAFVDDGNTYVCMGDGHAGASETDIMIELQGVELDALTTLIIVTA